MKHLTRYAVATWPDSQEFVGNPDCILINTEGMKDPTGLDSSYLVPEHITGPLGKSETYVRVPFPDSQRFHEMTTADPEDILKDYDTQDAYVRETVYDTNTDRRYPKPVGYAIINTYGQDVDDEGKPKEPYATADYYPRLREAKTVYDRYPEMDKTVPTWTVEEKTAADKTMSYTCRDRRTGGLVRKRRIEPIHFMLNLPAERFKIK